MVTPTLPPAVDAPAPRSAERAAVWRTLALIAGSVVLNTLIGAFVNEKVRFLLMNDLALSTHGQALFSLLAGLPGYLRPFMGAGSDLFPLFGFHRRSYYALSWAILAAGFLGLSALHAYHYGAVLFLMITVGAGGNLLFVIMDAVMVAVGNRTGSVPRFQTVQQAAPGLLGLTFLGPLTGYLTQHFSNHFDFFWGGLLALCGVPLALLVEDRRVAGRRQAPGAEAQGTEAQEAAQGAERRAERAQTTQALADAVRTPGLWVVVGFVFFLILTPGLNVAQLNYSVKVLHFDKQFIGTLGLPQYWGGALGFGVFLLLARRAPVRALVWGALLMDAALYVIPWALHDRPSAVVVAALGGLLGTVYNLCLLTLAARATPPRVEGAVYGLVVAATLLGGTLGELIGSSLYDAFGPHSHHPPIDGWHALLIFGLVFTVFAAVFIPFLPDWARSREPLQARQPPPAQA